jgi:surface protein
MEPITDRNFRTMVYNYCRENNSNNYPPIGTWDVSAVTIMSLLFLNAESFNEDISSWNVSNVTDMHGMFQNAKAFNQPLDNWDVSNVTNMFSMFRDADAFNQPLNNWDVSNVTNMSSMFQDADAFNQPLNNWNVGNVRDMHCMFEYADMFNQPLNSWNVGNVSNMYRMFWNAHAFNQPLNSWNVRDGTTISSIFNETGKFNRFLTSLNFDFDRNIRLDYMYLSFKAKGTTREQQQALQSAIDERVRMEAANQPINESPYEECIICGDLLNNVIGPGNSEKCGQNCNDVVSVCRNNHRFHRGCILNACNADPVNIAAQMGFGEYPTNRPQQRRNKCPVCQVELLYPCDQFRTVEKVSDEELRNGTTGGRKRKTRKRNKKSNRKTKRRKQRKLKRRNYTKKYRI